MLRGKKKWRKWQLATSMPLSNVCDMSSKKNMLTLPDCESRQVGGDAGAASREIPQCEAPCCLAALSVALPLRTAVFINKLVSAVQRTFTGRTICQI